MSIVCFNCIIGEKLVWVGAVGARARDQLWPAQTSSHWHQSQLSLVTAPADTAPETLNSWSDITDNGIKSVIITTQLIQSFKKQSYQHVLKTDAMQGVFLETQSVDVQLEVKLGRELDQFCFIFVRICFTGYQAPVSSANFVLLISNYVYTSFVS